jgi:cation transport ATPase
LVDTIIFDKTGTLTQGVPAIIDLINYQDHMTPGHLLGLAAAAESRLRHPVAEALRARAKELQVNLPVCDETTGADRTANFFMPIFSFGPESIRIDRSVSIVGFAGMSGIFP